MTPLRLYSLIAGGTAIAAATAGYYWIRSQRRTPEQREMERRLRISASGRITDGTVLDANEYTEEGSHPVQLLIYTYDVAGVTYECSQDITQLRHFVDVHTCKIGVPASIKYDPQNPGNSIVIAEHWSGLRN